MAQLNEESGKPTRTSSSNFPYFPNPEKSHDSTTDHELGQISDLASGAPGALKDSFNIWSCLGMQFSLTSTPLAVGAYLASVIGVGGSPVLIFGYLFAVGCNLCVCASLAEIAAVYPHVSGQVHWTAMMAPKRCARILSYLAAWITAAAFFTTTASCCLLASQLIFALVQVLHASFVIQPWHYYLGYLGSALIALAMNISLFKLYPYMLKGLVVYINGGALFIFIVLLVRTHPKQSASFVFTDFENMTGWSTDGVVFFLGLLPSASAVNGFDGVAHLASEVPQPEKNIPRVMFGSAVLSALSGFPMILVYMFCIVSPENLLAPIGGQPIAQLLLDSLDSQALTIIGILIYAICMVAASVSCLTGFSRILWSLANQGALPFPAWISSVDTYHQLPVNAIMTSFILVLVIGTVWLGSSTALNAILGAGIVMCYLSYILVIGSLLYRGRNVAFPTKRFFNLGRAGILLNGISIVWMPFITTWLCFPSYVPVTSSTMNYASVVIGGVFIVACVNWFAFSRKRYKVPVAMHL
ncbi:putative choline and nitrogen mustard permease [Xylariales sp. AK1849]|nr:putative choline and nitrogen mustard permease [Xylariales sp. AK1849]